MKKPSSALSGTFVLRSVLGCGFLALSALLGFLAFAADPPAGTIGPSGPTLTWAGTGTGTPPTGGAEDACEEGNNCDSFKLTVSGTPADWAAAVKVIHVQINWISPSTDYDLYVHKGSLAGPVVASSGSGGTTSEQVDLDPRRSSIGTGDFIVHVVYFAATLADQYTGTATLAAAAPLPAPAPVASGPPQRFENFNPPAAGPNTLGRSSGEPSIGVGLPIPGHPEGRAMFQSDVQTLRVTFNGACAKPLWENKPAPTSLQDFDPILFTDFLTGRTIVHLLSFVGNVIAGESSFTDSPPSPSNDGDVWTPSKGSGIGSGVDHQTVGGGPYAPPLDILPHPYPHAVYYCSQALVDASCARSDDGGVNYGPSVVAYRTECGGLHGHVKVAPDGTVYLPNKGCGTSQAVVVSEDNGLTWEVRKILGSASAGSDPSVGVGSAGRAYFGYADGDTTAAISVSNDKGKTWSAPLDAGAVFGINNVAFPEVVAGDNDRAAFAFLGTPTAGGLQGPKFAGIWHLYVATTFDGGATWSTVDATPNDPVQRGCIWLGGGANICRNMLDFNDVQIDHEGRVLVAYADGCAGGECVLAPSSATGNSYTALAAIARQSGGRRLLAAFDPPNAAVAPGTPFLSAKRNGGLVRLSWSEGDDGGSAITGYNVLRSTSAGTETLLATVPATQLRYDDPTATDPAVTYYYKVVAVNGQGSSCGDNEVSARFVGSSYADPGFTVSADPTGDQTGAPANADLDVQTLSIAEPGTGPDAGRLVFNLKVADLTTSPNSRMWRIVWNSPNSEFGQFYVGMTKDAAGAVSFEYGTVETVVVGLALGVPTTHKLGTPDSGSSTPGGLITIGVAKAKVGNPQTGDLLGAFSTRTYATVTDQIRSTNAIDLTTNATANDATANAATYALVGPQSARLQNISTRALVGSGDKVLIGGFIITGNDAKRVIVRGRGPSLAGFQGIVDPIHDPVIDLYNGTPNNPPIASNDDWQATQKTEIEATGLAPSSPLEGAIVQTLAPGAYTLILRDKDQSTPRLGIVEVFDVGPVANSQLANLSSRGFVGTGDNVLIGGVIVGPANTGIGNFLVRSLGPSLGSFGVSGALPDPTIKLISENGTQIAANDDWRANETAIQAQAPSLAPTRNEEAALIASLAPGLYTVIVEGKNTTGVATVEVYSLGSP
jgi:hypothetical protein